MGLFTHTHTCMFVSRSRKKKAVEGGRKVLKKNCRDEGATAVAAEENETKISTLIQIEMLSSLFQSTDDLVDMLFLFCVHFKRSVLIMSFTMFGGNLSTFDDSRPPLLPPLIDVHESVELIDYEQNSF